MKKERSRRMTKTEMRQIASGRVSAKKIQRVVDNRLITEYRPRLAGNNVCHSGRETYPTREEAIDAARRMKATLRRVAGVN